MMKPSARHGSIPGGDNDLLSAGSVILHVLAQTGAAGFRQIADSRLARTAGAHLNENSYYTALARLRRRGLIDKDSYGYALTADGEWAAMKAHVRHGVLTSRPVAEKTGKAWDGKWRIVLFDFPESRRAYRDYIRGVLKRLEFQEFQRSMWISPYRLPAFLVRLFGDPRMVKNVRFVTSQDINYDTDLRRKFRLS